MGWATFIAFALCANSCRSQPRIGILTGPSSSGSKEELAASYVDWLQAAGAMVVPIPSGATWNTSTPWWTYEFYQAWTPGQYKKVFSEINGLVLPGGDPWSQVSSHAFRQLYQLAVEASTAGDIFPIWGTCAGFESLIVMAGGTCQANVSDGQIPIGECAAAGPVTRGWDSVGVPLPLVLSGDAIESRLFRSIPHSLLTAAQLEKVSYHSHSGGVGVRQFQSNPSLSKTYKVLSTNRDLKDHLFISTIEGIELPFYGTQWHPEMNMYEWEWGQQKIPHSPEAIALARGFADFFVSEARKSHHRFPSPENALGASIYNFAPTTYNFSRPYETRTFYFNWTVHEDDAPLV